MALTPNEIEVKKRMVKDRYFQTVVNNLESYLDQMLVMDHRDILIDRALDEEIPLKYRDLIKEDPEIAEKIIKNYRVAGWKIEFRADYTYVNFKEG